MCSCGSMGLGNEKNASRTDKFLYINHNTRTTKGYYYVRKTTDDSKGRLKDDEKRYPKWNTIKLFQRSRYLMTN